MTLFLVSGEEVSLTIEESNRLREKLGLKPLKVQDSNETQEGAAPGTGSMENDVLLAPVLPGAKEQQDLVRRRPRSTLAPVKQPFCLATEQTAFAKGKAGHPKETCGCQDARRERW